MLFVHAYSTWGLPLPCTQHFQQIFFPAMHTALVRLTLLPVLHTIFSNKGWTVMHTSGPAKVLPLPHTRHLQQMLSPTHTANVWPITHPQNLEKNSLVMHTTFLANVLRHAYSTMMPDAITSVCSQHFPTNDGLSCIHQVLQKDSSCHAHIISDKCSLPFIQKWYA